MGRQTGPQRRAAYYERAYDPSNWENWSQSKLREAYGSIDFNYTNPSIIIR